jgi:NADH-quinone oxidoreductase subunit M
MSGETNAVTSVLTDLNYHERLVLYPVVILVILIGVYPAPLLDISEVAVKNLLSLYPDLSASLK